MAKKTVQRDPTRPLECEFEQLEEENENFDSRGFLKDGHRSLLSKCI